VARHLTKAVQLRTLDLAALLLVLGYTLLALRASGGGRIGPTALDATWARVQASGELRVAIDAGFAPFSGLAEGSSGPQLIGYDADLARALAGRLGVRARFVPTGFDALYEALARGEADLIASALSYAPELSWRARFSQVYFNAGQVLLARRSGGLDPEVPLDGLRLGAILGGEGDTLLRRAERSGTRLTRRSGYDEAGPLLADLRAGRLDAAIVDNATALAAANDDPELVLLRALSFEPYVLAVPPDAYQLQAETNAALDSLTRTGCLAALNARWFTAQPPAEATELPVECR
jgi:ABC-type amino acid transport substrate-binding protein